MMSDADIRWTGHFVRALISLPAGIHLVGAGSYISWNEYADIWGKHNGVDCVFEKQDRSVMESAPGPMALVGREIADMFVFVDEFGYDGGDEGVVYPWDLKDGEGGKVGKRVEVEYTTMERYMELEDWSSILGA